MTGNALGRRLQAVRVEIQERNSRRSVRKLAAIEEEPRSDSNIQVIRGDMLVVQTEQFPSRAFPDPLIGDAQDQPIVDP